MLADRGVPAWVAGEIVDRRAGRARPDRRALTRAEARRQPEPGPGWPADRVGRPCQLERLRSVPRRPSERGRWLGATGIVVVVVRYVVRRRRRPSSSSTALRDGGARGRSPPARRARRVRSVRRCCTSAGGRPSSAWPWPGRAPWLDPLDRTGAACTRRPRQCGHRQWLQVQPARPLVPRSRHRQPGDRGPRHRRSADRPRPVGRRSGEPPAQPERPGTRIPRSRPTSAIRRSASRSAATAGGTPSSAAVAKICRVVSKIAVAFAFGPLEVEARSLVGDLDHAAGVHHVVRRVEDRRGRRGASPPRGGPAGCWPRRRPPWR